MKWKVCSETSPPLPERHHHHHIIIIIHHHHHHVLPCHDILCSAMPSLLLVVAVAGCCRLLMSSVSHSHCLHQVAIYIDLPAAIRETNFHLGGTDFVFTDGAAGVSLYAALGEDKRYPALVLSFVRFVPSTDMCIQQHQEGVPFFQSANEVILSPGINGTVPAKYFSRVKDLSS